MCLRFCHAVIALLLSALLSSCSVAGVELLTPRKVYEVRDLTVLADVRVPQTVVVGTDSRIAAAIAATVPRPEAPPVVLSVRIGSYRPDISPLNRRSEATVTVTAISVIDGSPVATATFPVTSETETPDFEAEALAEAVAARIRLLFALSMPSARQ
ncbi:hypothetical protein DFR48_101634 [Ciceribacter lividus]|uniref:LPS-assembly lipoprotein n=1 Tax=Ciceribacter lividus TaxID=1197950 RepID=A0A6I7HX64_9HYPH|nr:hypothetical protein [Ciceribacter lividus]RCW28617.1 hypothetical protein DFR48_101634 [Ciceribacter lividus]